MRLAVQMPFQAAVPQPCLDPPGKRIGDSLFVMTGAR